MESPKASNITIYITSPAVFNDLMKIDSHPTSRTILKITDYQILEAILHQLLLYETTPTFILAPLDDTNSIHPFQKTAAESAEEIRTESEYAQNRLLPFIPTFSKDLHYFQFKSNTRPLRFDAYCRKILKGQEQDRLEALNLTKLNEIWLGNATFFTHESYVLSANLTNKGLPKSSPLDATHYKTHALNLKILCRNLQSRETLAGYKTMFITNETCSNCNEKETPQHVFVCTYTQANYHTIYSQTKTYLQEELQIYFQSKKAKNPTLASYPQDYHERILKELNIDSPQFLRDNQAQGVIIKINKFKENIDLQTPFPSHIWLYTLAMGCYQRSFDIKIWRPRTAIVMKENSDNKKEYDRQRRNTQRQAPNNNSDSTDSSLITSSADNNKAYAAALRDNSSSEISIPRNPIRPNPHPPIPSSPAPESTSPQLDFHSNIYPLSSNLMKLSHYNPDYQIEIFTKL